MKLATDLDKEGSLSVMSLATDLESVDLDKLEEENTVARPKIIKATGSNTVLQAMGIAG